MLFCHFAGLRNFNDNINLRNFSLATFDAQLLSRVAEIRLKSAELVQLFFFSVLRVCATLAAGRFFGDSFFCLICVTLLLCPLSRSNILPIRPDFLFFLNTFGYVFKKDDLFK